MFGPDGDVIDANHHVCDANDLSSGKCALIRPDGHIGATVASDAVEALERDLEEAGLA